MIRSKYPYLILWKEKQEGLGEHQIHVAKPQSWSESPMMSAIEFTIHNTSLLHTHLPRHHERKSINFKLFFHGVLHAETVADSSPVERWTFRRAIETPQTAPHYCTMNNLVPGKWKYDPTFTIRAEDKWEGCHELYYEEFEHYWYCNSSYHGLQYFPDSNCHVLPLQQSLFLLYQHSPIEGLLEHSNDKPYFFFMGDSLIIQLCATGRCELHTHANMILHQAPYNSSRPSLRTLGYQARYRWNQFLRSDFPCSTVCADETFLKTVGLKKNNRHDTPPCQGCPDGNIAYSSPLDRHDLFHVLFEVPRSVRVLLINAGAWFTSNHIRDQNTTKIYRETLEAFIPHLASFQKERKYQVDIYFLPLPGVDPSLANSPAYEWDEYEEKNQILFELFSPQSLAAHNLTVTILPNHQLFQRKHLIDGETNVFLADNLHYCIPGAFSPDSFLFELIVHNHVIKTLNLTP